MGTEKREQTKSRGSLPQPVKVVLLGINSQYIHSSLAPWCLKAGLDSYARAAFDCTIEEGTINEQPSVVLDRITQRKPDVLGICCYIWNIRFIQSLLPDIREALPECVIVLGGPEVSHRAQDTLFMYPQADYLIAGEGEWPFARLLDALCGREDLEEVPGLCRRKADGFIIREPFCHDAMQPTPYSPAYFAALHGRIAYLETSRGCPYACAFCLSGKKERLRQAPPDRVREEILLLSQSPTKTIKLVDRTFNADQKRAREIMAFIAHHAECRIPSGVTFHFELAGDLLDDDTLALIAATPPGLFQFEIGLQSMDETTLRRVRRQTDMAYLSKQVSRLIHIGRAHVHLDLIAGLPGEGLAEFSQSFNQAYMLRPHALQLGFLKLIHGSAMRDEPEIYPCRYDPQPPYQVQSTPWLSQEDLALLQTAERALDKLHNRGRFVKTLYWLTSRANIEPFQLFLTLGRFIQKAEATGGRLSLDCLTDCVYSSLLTLFPAHGELLRDLLLQDRLSSTATTVLPACLKKRDSRYHKIKRSLDKLFPRPKGIVRAFGILYAGDSDQVVFCDYDKKDPVTGLYFLRYIPAEECLAARA